MRTSRHGRVGVGIIATALLVATAYGASAADNRSAVVVRLSGRVDATVDPVTDPRCAGQGYAVSGTAIYKGTLDGVGDFCNNIVAPPLVEPDDLGFRYYEEHTFVGTVQGCGTGTFRYTVDGVAYPLDADQERIPGDEDWRIVGGSGTGDLVGIRSGVNHRTGGVNVDGTAFAVFDPATNSLTCIPAPQSRSDGRPSDSASSTPSSSSAAVTLPQSK
jgi:hypothetical protein